MKQKPDSERVDKLSVSLGKDMSAWLRRMASKKRSNVSQVIRELLIPAFDARHAK
jgi:hypothetical protein